MKWNIYLYVYLVVIMNKRARHYKTKTWYIPQNTHQLRGRRGRDLW